LLRVDAPLVAKNDTKNATTKPATTKPVKPEATASKPAK
jgi:hypothetical protein